MIQKKSRTVFSTPVVAHVLRFVSAVWLRLSGWRLVGEPPALKKYVLIAAPHTSNWDFPLMLQVVLKFGLDVHWMGKHSLFPFPFGGFMRWLGGIPINRSAAHQTVEQVAAAFQRSEELILVITPEGTRGKVNRWKAGFYHIAQRVDIPIQLAFVDAATRTVGFGPLFQPTGDFEADLAEIRAFYQGKVGIRREFS